MHLKKLLILRFSSIGDIVLTTPVIRCLRKRYPKAIIHFLCKTKFANILEANPYLDKIHHFEKDISSILPILRKEGYDVVIDLHKNLRSIRLRKALNVKSYSFHKANWAKWLMVNLKINQLPKQHIVLRYLEATKPLDVSYDGGGMDYFIPKRDIFRPTEFDLAKNEPFIVFAIGAAHATKRLPINQIKAICSKVKQKIVLIGGPGEKDIGKEVTNSISNVINSCGKLSLHQSADAVRQSILVLSHDTGMMHIAAALGKKIVSVWGNTIPEFGMYPYYSGDLTFNTFTNKKSKIIEVKDLSCRPCSKIGFSNCPKGHFKCMNSIDIEEVRQAVLGLLSDNN